MRKETWVTKGLINGREPLLETYNLDYFMGGSSDGITYPKEKNYLNPDSEYRYKFIDILGEVQKYIARGSLLDVASGPGHLSTWSKRKNLPYNVVNLDISHEILNWARHEYNIPNPVVADANALPFSQNSFEGVLFLDVLEHVWPSQAKENVKSGYKLLKPNGCIFIMIPNRITWDSKPSQYEGHIWLPSIAEMKSLLKQSGFKSNSINHFTRGFPFSNSWRQKHDNDFRFPSFGRSIFIVAKK